MLVTTDFSQAAKPCALAMGLFDGVHLGHRQVIAAMEQQAQIQGLTASVLSFTTGHSRPEKKKGQEWILSHSQKLERLQSLGVSQVICPDFAEIRDLEPEAFVKDVLKRQLGARVLVCGYDFRFGRKARGDVALLKQYGRETGLEVLVVPAYYQDGAPVSSTRIRGLLKAGKVEQANRLLGDAFSIRGEVVYGNQLGHTRGYPTANQEFQPGCIIPRFGVYATVAELEGRQYRGVTNVGVKPTIAGERKPLAETYLLGYQGTAYGKTASVRFAHFMRGERRFDSLDQLYREIQTNVEQVRQMDDLEIFMAENCW